MRAWGFRRIEDIAWLKTNKTVTDRLDAAMTSAAAADASQLLARVKEHCIMGVSNASATRGRDGLEEGLLHPHTSTDVVVSEEPPFGSTAKPDDIYRIIEHFCQSKRRVELFGDERNIRPGWVTIGDHIATSNWNTDLYRQALGTHHLVPQAHDIDVVRPHSPTHKKKK